MSAQVSCRVGGELICYHEDYMAENEHPADFGATGHRAQAKLLRGNANLKKNTKLARRWGRGQGRRGGV